MNSKSDSFLDGLLAIDIGNSRLKLLHKNSFTSYSYIKYWTKNFQSFFSRIAERPLRVIYSSVNPQIEEYILEYLKSIDGIYVFNAEDLLKQQNKVRIDSIKGIGADRILGLLGAMEETAPPLVTVDFGTAVTLNCVDSDSNCLGGIIFAGIETQLFGLEKMTKKIKNVKFKLYPRILGTNTDEAVSNGVFASVFGGIIFVFENVRKELFDGKNIPIFFTGGGYEYLKERIEHWEYPNKFYRKHLVLQGLLSLARNQRQFILGF